MFVVVQKPVSWLGNAKSNDTASLKSIFSERDAALRLLLQGKKEDLVVGENNLREFEFIRSKLIFPNSDDANQNTKQEEVGDVTGEQVMDIMIRDPSVYKLDFVQFVRL